MKVINKYIVKDEAGCSVLIPQDAQILAISLHNPSAVILGQTPEIAIHALVDTHSAIQRKTVYLVASGEELPNCIATRHEYLGYVHYRSRNFVVGYGKYVFLEKLDRQDTPICEDSLDINVEIIPEVAELMRKVIQCRR